MTRSGRVGKNDVCGQFRVAPPGTSEISQTPRDLPEETVSLLYLGGVDRSSTGNPVDVEKCL